MQISYNTTSSLFEIHTKNTHIQLEAKSVRVNTYLIDFPGEYEQGGVFVEAREYHNVLMYVITAESASILYFPSDISAEALELLRDVHDKDVIVFPARESLWKVVETWEPSVVIPYGAEKDDFLMKLGQHIEEKNTLTLKELDLHAEQAMFVNLA